MSKIKNGGLDQYGGELFEQQQFGTAGVEGVKVVTLTQRNVCMTKSSCLTFRIVNVVFCYPNATTLCLGLCYCKSVICDVCMPYSAS